MISAIMPTMANDLLHNFPFWGPFHLMITDTYFSLVLDPHIKVAGKAEDVRQAKKMLNILDAKVSKENCLISFYIKQM